MAAFIQFGTALFLVWLVNLVSLLENHTCTHVCVWEFDCTNAQLHGLSRILSGEYVTLLGPRVLPAPREDIILPNFSEGIGFLFSLPLIERAESRFQLSQSTRLHIFAHKFLCLRSWLGTWYCACVPSLQIQLALSVSVGQWVESHARCFGTWPSLLSVLPRFIRPISCQTQLNNEVHAQFSNRTVRLCCFRDDTWTNAFKGKWKIVIRLEWDEF